MKTLWSVGQTQIQYKKWTSKAWLSWSNASSHWVLVSGNSRLPSEDSHDSLQSWATPPHAEPKSLKAFLPCAKTGRRAGSGVIKKKKMPLGTASHFPFRKIISLYNFFKWQNQLEKNNYPVKVSWPQWICLWSLWRSSMELPGLHVTPALSAGSFYVALLAFNCVQPCICPWARLLLVVFMERRLNLSSLATTLTA